MNRRIPSVILLSLVCAGLFALAGCGDSGISGEDQGEVTTAKSEGEASGDLTISNWPLYIDKQTIPDFERKTGVSVKYVEDINSYDEFFGKMQPQLARGQSGDRSLMVATDWLAKKMYDLGYLQNLDQDELAPAFSHLSPVAKPPVTDPDRKFSIPWQGGMTGLIVNERLAPDVHSVNDLFDPRYKGRVEMLSEMRETPALVMKADGIDPKDATTQDWLDTIDKLKAASDSGQIRKFTGNDYVADLASGDAVAVIGWAADANQLQADNPDIKWVMPEQGCLVWWDNWVIPVGAPNPTAAYKWINYTYAPENQAQIVAWTSAITPVSGVREIFEKSDPELAGNELIFPTEKYTENCSGVVSPPGDQAAQGEVEDAWLNLLSGS